MISKQCSYETVGHEIGHNFGIWHKSTWNGDNYRTIMTAYSGAINYYSNPMVQYEVRTFINFIKHVGSTNSTFKFKLSAKHRTQNSLQSDSSKK